MRTFIWILPLLLTVFLNAQKVDPDVSAVEAPPVNWNLFQWLWR